MSQLIHEFLTNGGKIQNIPPLPAEKRPNYWGHKNSVANKGRKKETLKAQGCRSRLKESKDKSKHIQLPDPGKNP